jgi:hypothetical protein
MRTDLTINARPSSRALAVFDKPLTGIMPAFETGNRLSEHYADVTEPALGHSACCVRPAIQVRSEHRLHWFLQADAAARMLLTAQTEKLERRDAADMVRTFYRVVGGKSEESTAMLMGALDMIEANDIAAMSGLWEPLNVSPTVLALACRKLIAETVKFVPKPGELREACKEAERKLYWAYRGAQDLVERTREADAILLSFAHDEWERPYRTAGYRPILPRMLELHAEQGDDSVEWYEAACADEGNSHPFAQLVRAEQAKLALPAPETQRAAACEAKQEKRKRKPKQQPER